MVSRVERKESLSAQVDAAIKYLQNESISTVSISGVCRIVNVNRANLYAHYPECLDKIRAARAERSALGKPVRPTVARLSLEMASLKKQLKATTYICIELQLALKLVREKLRRESAMNLELRKRRKRE